MPVEDIVDKIEPQEPVAPEATPEAEVATPEAEAPKVEVKAEKPKAKKETVPLATLIEEREKYGSKLKELEEKVQKYSTLEEKLNKFYREQEEASKPKPFSFEENPVEFLRYQNEDLAQQTKTVLEKTNQLTEQHQRQEAVSKLVTQMRSIEDEYVATTPDYYKALNFVREKEIKRWQLAGHSRQEAMEFLAQAEINTIAVLTQKGHNPAEYAYKVALEYGFKPEGKEEKEEISPEEEKLAKVEEGIKSSKTLGSVKPGLQDLSRLPLSEFQEAVSELFHK